MSSTEVISAAIVREAVPGMVAGDVKAAAERVIQKVDKNEWRAGLKELQQSISPSLEQIQDAAEQIGITRHPTTGNKTRVPAEQIRFDRVLAEGKLAKKIADKGWDNLTIGLGSERAQVISKITQTLQRRPALRDRFNALTPGDKEAMIKRISSNSHFVDHLNTYMHAVLSEVPLTDSVTAATHEYEIAELEATNKSAEHAALTAKIAEVNHRLADFERSATGPIGTLAVEIDSRLADKANAQTIVDMQKTRIETLQKSLDSVNQQITRLSGSGTAPAFTPLSAEALRLQGEITAAQAVLQPEQQKLFRLAQLQETEKMLKEEQAKLEKEEREKDVEEKKAKLTQAKKLQELADAKNLRQHQEDDYVNKFNEAIGYAADQLLDDQIEELTSIYNKHIEDEKSSQKEQNEKVLYDVMKTRWSRTVTRRKWNGTVNVPMINTANVTADYTSLMTSGPDALINTLLTGRLTPDEISTLLADKEYSNKVRADLVQQLVGRKINSTGLARGDIYQLLNEPWGQGVVANTIQQNAATKEQVEKVLGEGALDRPGWFNRLGVEIRRNPGLLAIILAGLAVGGVAGLAGVAGAGLATGTLWGGGVGLGAAVLDIGSRASDASAAAASRDLLAA